MENKGIFDRLAGTYVNSWGPAEEAKIKKIIEAAGGLKGARVLDAGAGKGDFAARLLKASGKKGSIVLVDCSVAMLAFAKHRFAAKKNMSVRVCSVTKMPFKKCFFNAAFCFNSFPHFYPKHDVLAEISRVVKKGGMLVIGHTEGRAEINAFHRKYGFDMRKHVLPQASRVATMLKKHSFRVVVMKEKPFYLIVAKKTD